MKWLLSILFFSHFLVHGQSDSATWKEDFRVGGYLRYMGTATVFNSMLSINHLMHNRFNLSYDINENQFISAGIRTRIFNGANLNNGDYASFSEVLEVDNGAVDMSYVSFGNDYLLVHHHIDRFYWSYLKNSWEWNIGRQRINWGVNYLWNPNDVFNAYSFVDFDYTERPGNDAVRVTRYFKNFSSIEVAVKPGKLGESMIYGVKHYWNKFNYDWQWIAGGMNEDLYLGFGVAGSVKAIGLKSEATLFYNGMDGFDLSASIGLDYMLNGSWTLASGYLVNTSALNGNMGNVLGWNNELSAKNLLPVPHAVYVMLSKQINPILSGAMVGVFVPGAKGMFLMPSITSSISSSLELSYYSQMMLGAKLNGVKYAFSSHFLRLAYTF